VNLDLVRIVLVETTHPGNIGGAARAMKNMGLSHLVLVRPRHFPSAEATARASGADDLLAAATVVDDLDTALAGCNLVLGTSARLRTLTWPQVDARGCGEQVRGEALEGRQAAVVFGREHSGLTNEELERCNYLVHIPTAPDFGSLNLAAAVQVIGYELHMAMLAVGTEPEAEPVDYVTADELEGLYSHLWETMVTIGFLDPDNPRQVMRRLRRLFNRARLERAEFNILRGILTEAQRAARTPRRAATPK